MALTIPELIETVLSRIWKEHYENQSRRDQFFRDERALTKAIARYGYECDSRGWDFDPSAIWAELMRVLDTMRGRDAAIRSWFPVYLEASVDRHIRIRADELSAEAKRDDRSAWLQARPRDASQVADRVVARVSVERVRAPTTCEQLATLYRDLASKKRERRARKQAGKPADQKEMRLL